MGRGRRVRETAKWGALGLCAGLLLLWAAAALSGGAWEHTWHFANGPEPPAELWLCAHARGVEVQWDRPEPARTNTIMIPATPHGGHPRKVYFNTPATSFPIVAPSTPSFAKIGARFELRTALLPQLRTVDTTRNVHVPAWLLLLVARGVTALLWLRSRRAAPGHCRCGYNLTGNVSGVCPECGTALQKRAAAHET